MADNRQLFVDTAVAWHGRKESDGSHREIIDTYNTIKPLPRGYWMEYHDAWCAAFVSAVAQKLKLTDIVFPECGCGKMIAKYQAAGRWIEDDAYVPKKGDIIFYDWEDTGKGDTKGGSDHVGIVVSVGSKNIKVIEGNMNNDVGYRNIAINGRYIRGFGLPDFEGKPIEVPEKDEPKSEEPKQEEPKQEEAKPKDTERITVSVKIPQIEKGAIGNSVKSLQLLLIGNGVSCGYTGADGEFGSMTEKAVITWQKKKSLEVDGVVGAETWASLLN